METREGLVEPFVDNIAHDFDFDRQPPASPSA